MSYETITNEIVVNLACELYKAYWDNNDVRIREVGDYDTWENISDSERRAWIAAAEWTYDNVWSAETVVYFPDHK